MNESQVQEQSSSISEHSYEISSSETTLLRIFEEYSKMLKKKKDKERFDHKLAEYKEKIEETLKKSDMIEQNLKEKEQVITDMKELVDEKEKQMERLSQTIKELEDQLIIAQATPKPQRVMKLV